jgi:3-phosphoshikimate 1-carboxyvinyltransferase
MSLVADGPLEIRKFPGNQDCQSSLAAVTALGAKLQKTETGLQLAPPEGPFPADLIVDCGNSGTTTRLLSGIIAGTETEVTLTGDESLRSRPMKRIIDPLTTMGARLFSDDGRLPMRIQGGNLTSFEYRLPVASAQVKSALLLAGLASSCSIIVREDHITRDHTERMIAHLGEGIVTRDVKPVMVADPIDPRKRKMVRQEPFKREITLDRKAIVHGGEIDIPGDLSTAAFFLAAAAISGRTVTVEGLGLNPTRTAFLDHLRAIGCTVEISDKKLISGEPRGTVKVTGGQLRARKISGAQTVALIDEIPIISVMAAFSKGTTIIRDAAELKVKESDRLAATAHNLNLMGARCGVMEDGLAIDPGMEKSGADFVGFGDHRIAMAFSIAALFLEGPSSIDDDSVVAISCPEFYDLLKQITS